jgi:hypothetical protein
MKITNHQLTKRVLCFWERQAPAWTLEGMFLVGYHLSAQKDVTGATRFNNGSLCRKGINRVKGVQVTL